MPASPTRLAHARSLPPRVAAQYPRWWNTFPANAMRGPCGHHIKSDIELDDDGSTRYRCRHWIGPEHRECGQWMWLYRFNGGLHFVVEILDDADRAQLNAFGTASAKLGYLGIFQQLQAAAASDGPRGESPRPDLARPGSAP